MRRIHTTSLALLAIGALACGARGAMAQRSSAGSGSSTAVRDDESIWGASAIEGPMSEDAAPRPIEPQHWLVVTKAPGVEAWAVLAPYLLDATTKAPTEGKPAGADAHSTWRWEARETRSPSNVACAYTSIATDLDEVRMARLDGGELLFVNGDCVVGDVERRGFGGAPIVLRKGVNRMFVAGVPSAFTLELWSPRSRMVIATWDVSWPGIEEPDGELVFPVFNASRTPAEGLHLHYGHTVADGGPEPPRVLEWRDRGYVEPLAMHESACYCYADDPTQGLPQPLSDSAVLIVPVVVCASDDTRCDRELLRCNLKRAVSGAARPTRKKESALAGTLFEMRTAVLVYGTLGSPEEDAALAARARFDQQLIAYRTGRIPSLLSDEKYIEAVAGCDAWKRMEVRAAARARRETVERVEEDDELDTTLCEMIDARSIVLYGNEDTNAAWSKVLAPECPVRVRRGSVQSPKGELMGDDLAGWFVWPERSDARTPRHVIVIADTGARGTRTGYGLQSLTSPSDANEFAFHRFDSATMGAPRCVAEGTLRKR